MSWTWPSVATSSGFTLVPLGHGLPPCTWCDALGEATADVARTMRATGMIEAKTKPSVRHPVANVGRQIESTATTTVSASRATHARSTNDLGCAMPEPGPKGAPHTRVIAHAAINTTDAATVNHNIQRLGRRTMPMASATCTQPVTMNAMPSGAHSLMCWGTMAK